MWKNRHYPSSWLTGEPDESIVFVCVIRSALYCPHQAIHLSQAGSVHFATTWATGGDGSIWRDRRGQGNMHVSKCQVEEIGLSLLPARTINEVTLCQTTDIDKHLTQYLLTSRFMFNKKTCSWLRKYPITYWFANTRHYCPNSADFILTCYSNISTTVTNNINNGCVTFNLEIHT